MTYIFIVNPVAGNGRAVKLFSEIKQSTLYHETESKYYYTKYPGHATEIVQSMLSNRLLVACIIVVGGDGTLYEVVNGMGRENIPISFIPGGSGNDFARGCAIRGNPLEIFNEIINGQHAFPYWLGNYKLNDDVIHSFVSNMGIGFDASVAKSANQSKYKILLNRLRIGKLSYLIALLHVLYRFKPQTVKIEMDGKQRVIQDCWMVTITNHPYYGGGMKIIPNANIQPTKFPVLVLRGISKWKVLGLFMTIFTGQHIHFKEVELLTATKLHISTEEPINIQVDGQTSSCTSCTISKQSGAIQVMGTNRRKEIGA